MASSGQRLWVAPARAALGRSCHTPARGGDGRCGRACSSGLSFCCRVWLTHATQPQGTQPALRQPRPLGSPALSFLGAQSFEDTPSGDLKPEARRLRAEGARLLPVLMIDSNSLGTAGAREEGPSWAGAGCVLSALRARGRWVLPVGLRRALRL